MSTNVIETKICGQCGRMWNRERASEQMCPSCRRDLDVMNGNAIGPAPGTVARAEVVALVERWEREAAGYRAQIEECRGKGLEVGCQLGTKTGLEQCAKELRGLL